MCHPISRIASHHHFCLMHCLCWLAVLCHCSALLTLMRMVFIAVFFMLFIKFFVSSFWYFSVFAHSSSLFSPAFQFIQLSYLPSIVFIGNFVIFFSYFINSSNFSLCILNIGLVGMLSKWKNLSFPLLSRKLKAPLTNF